MFGYYDADERDEKGAVERILYWSNSLSNCSEMMKDLEEKVITNGKKIKMRLKNNEM